MSSKYFVYILKTSAGTFYVGQTKDLNKRLQTHLAGKGSKYLRMYNYFDLVYKIEVETRSKALKLEHQIKHLSHAQKAALISN